MSTTATIANETNPISEGYYNKPAARTITLRELQSDGGKVTRVRILTERTERGTICDVSYVHGEIHGVRFNVQLALGLLVPMGQLKGELIAWAKREGVYAKALGLLDEGNWSVLR